MEVRQGALEVLPFRAEAAVHPCQEVRAVQEDHQVAVGDRVVHRVAVDHRVAGEAEEVPVSGEHRVDQVEHQEAEVAAEDHQVDQRYLAAGEAVVDLPFLADRAVAAGNPDWHLEQRHLP